MSTNTESFFDRFVFPALDWLQVEALRHPCTQVSAVVRELTGLWVHPASWELLGGLLVGLAGLLAVRGRRRRGQRM